MWSVKNAETPKAKPGLSRLQTRLYIQQLHSSDAQNVKPPEENLDKPNSRLSDTTDFKKKEGNAVMFPLDGAFNSISHLYRQRWKFNRLA